MARPPRDILKRQRFKLDTADARTFIKAMPTASVDLILTDPPYNLNGYSTGNLKFTWRKEINNDLAEWDGVDFDPAEWASEFLRILKPTGNLFAFTSYNLIGKWHHTFDPLFDTFQLFVWHKTNPVPKVRRAGFLNSCELIACMWDKGHTWNFTTQKEMHNHIDAPICMGHERLKGADFHPTQKPIKVLSHLIGMASNPNDIVFDPFMGVGSTGVAALQLGRRFVGVELDPKYAKAAARRINRTTSLLPMNAATVVTTPAADQPEQEDLFEALLPRAA